MAVSFRLAYAVMSTLSALALASALANCAALGPGPMQVPIALFGATGAVHFALRARRAVAPATGGVLAFASTYSLVCLCLAAICALPLLVAQPNAVL